MIPPSNAFKEYVDYLVTSIEFLDGYREISGKGMNVNLDRIRKDLKASDPFVVFRASIAANRVLSDKSIYH